MTTLLSGDEKCLALLNQHSLVGMGILNVTPDSFSDGGRFSAVQNATRHAVELLNCGAHIIDVGGVSTRPGADAVSASEEWNRVFPVLEQLRKKLPQKALVSLDTSNVEVAFRAARSGLVDLINDVNAARSLAGNTEFSDSGLLPVRWTTADVAAKFRLGLVLMHMQGSPKTMQINPEYENCIEDVAGFLDDRLQYARTSGVRWCAIDPGIGFGKSLDHNLALMSTEGLARLGKSGVPVLIGLSRKSFLVKVAEREERFPVFKSQDEELLWRDQESGVWEKLCAGRGARIIRTHKMKN
jgi:dihydropteroate synthase